MRGPEFLLPRLLWDLKVAPAPSVTASAGPWLHGTVADEEALRQLLLAADPLILALNVAGYEVDGVSVALRPGGHADDPLDWLYLGQLATMQFVVEARGWGEVQPVAVPIDSEGVVGLSVHPRTMFFGRGPSYAVPLDTTAAGFGFEDVQAPDGSTPRSADALWQHAADVVADAGELRYLQVALKRPVPPASEPADRFLSAFLAALGDSLFTIGGLVQFDLLDGAAAWMEFPDSAAPHGLLGAYSHHLWTFPAERRTAPADTETIRGVGRDLWTLVFPDAAGLATFVAADLGDGHLLGDLIPRSRRAKGFSRELEQAVQARRDQLYGTGVDLKHKLSATTYIRALMLAHTLGVLDILGRPDTGGVSDGFDATPANRVDFDVTGWYETRLPDPQRSLPQLGAEDAEFQLMQLNQAGAVLTGYWQTRTTDPASGLAAVTVHRVRAQAAARPDTLVEITLGGQRHDALRHEYTFERAPDGASAPVVTGRLVIEEIYKSGTGWQAGDDIVHEVGMTVVYDDPADDPHGDLPVRYVRTAAGPHMSTAAISALGTLDRARIEALERRPLHTAELDAWTAAVGALIDSVRDYANLNVPIMKQNVARHADQDLRAAAARHVQVAADGTITADNGQLLALRDLAQQRLAQQAISVGLDTRTAFAWTNEMVLSQGGHTAGIRSLLELEPVMLALGGPRPWTYRWTMNVSGLEIDVPVLPFDFGKLTGDCEVTKADRASGQVVWTRRFAASANMLAVGLGGGVITSIRTGAETDWSIDWSWANFEGFYDVSGVTLSGVPGGGGQGSLVATFRFFGDETHTPPMSGSASGLSVATGLHGGASLSLMSGSLTLHTPASPPALTAEQVQAYLGRSVEVTDLLDTGLPFFDVGVETLTPEGWLALAEVCADHRAALESPWTPLKLTGHASTTGADHVNLPLSAERAVSVYEAIRALLGPAFAVAESGTFLGHRGEYDALLEIPDNTEDPDWRRVDLWFDASMLVRL